jgi:hypothetical protein
MKRFENRLAKLKRRLPAPADEPEDYHESFVEWAAKMPNGAAIIDYYRERIAPAMDVLIAKGVAPYYSYVEAAMVKEHWLPFGKMVYDAAVWMMDQPEYIAARDEFLREHERRKRKAAARRGQGV